MGVDHGRDVLGQELAHFCEPDLSVFSRATDFPPPPEGEDEDFGGEHLSAVALETGNDHRTGALRGELFVNRRIPTNYNRSIDNL
jgi:hypothetical protein